MFRRLFIAAGLVVLSGQGWAQNQQMTTLAVAAAATQLPLPHAPVYRRGAPATFTATVDGALEVDSYFPLAGERILVDDRAHPERSGIYLVIDAGSPSGKYVLARTDDALQWLRVNVRKGANNAWLTMECQRSCRWRSTFNGASEVR